MTWLHRQGIYNMQCNIRVQYNTVLSSCTYLRFGNHLRFGGLYLTFLNFRLCHSSLLLCSQLPHTLLQLSNLCFLLFPQLMLKRSSGLLVRNVRMRTILGRRFLASGNPSFAGVMFALRRRKIKRTHSRRLDIYGGPLVHSALLRGIRNNSAL